MLQKVFAYLAFLIKSTNAHGVHSPFVYDLLTKSLYGTPKQSRNKAEDIVLKCISYFGYSQVQIVGNTVLKQAIKAVNPTLKFEAHPVGLLYFEHPSAMDLEQALTKFALHNDSAILLDNIRGSAAAFELWQQHINHPKITVSLDFFHLGLLFIRKEQVKQHFYIRY